MEKEGEGFGACNISGQRKKEEPAKRDAITGMERTISWVKRRAVATEFIPVVITGDLVRAMNYKRRFKFSQILFGKLSQEMG